MIELSSLIFLLIFLLLFSAFCSCSEAALFSLSATRLRSYKSHQDKRKNLIATLLAHPQDLLVTIFILNTLVNILLQNVAANIFGDFSSWLLKVGVPLILTLILGEFIPKYLGLQKHISISYYVAPLVNFLQKLLKPIRTITIAITTPLSRMLFSFLRHSEPMTHEEISHALKTSEEHGVFSKEEGELLKGYFSLQNYIVKDIMRTREEILYFNLQEPLTKLIHLFVDQQCTRVPICHTNLDDVIGILSARQYLIHRDNIKTSSDIINLLNKPLYIPEGTPTKLLLKRFHEKRRRIALVVDEYGAISGLISREDLLEVVVGEISDLRDQVVLYTKSGPNEIIASGTLELDTVNEVFNSHLTSSSGMRTIGGWLIEHLGEIPKNGTQFTIEEFLFKVLAATPSRIQRLYIRKLHPRKH